MEIKLKDNLVIYVYAPKLTRNKAGGKVLYSLTEKLREIGFEAWIVCHSLNVGQEGLHLQISSIQMKEHLNNGVSILTIYPESVDVHLLKVGLPIRYLLAMPDELFNRKDFFPKSTKTFAYSKNIALAWDSTGPIVYFPTVDLKELSEIVPLKESEYRLIYTGKYLDLYKGKIPKELDEYPKLSRKISKKITRRDFLETIANAEALYCFENSTVALEALLLNVPVVFVPNPFLKNLILDSEFGGFGIAKDTSECALRNAKETVAQAKNSYLDFLDKIDFSEELIDWIHSLPLENRSDLTVKNPWIYLIVSRRLRAIRHKFYFAAVVFGRRKS